MAVSGSMSATLGAANPLRYRGYVYDSETSLYYLSSRYYNPVWGRFINTDTAAVVAASPDKANWDKNLFAYCDNKPVSRKDDGGDLWEEITTLGDIAAADAVCGGHLALGLGRVAVQAVAAADHVGLPVRQALPYQPPDQPLILPTLQVLLHGVVGPHHVLQIQGVAGLIRLDGLRQRHLPLQLPLGAEVHEDFIRYPLPADT